jgi:hypothetical protein
MVRSVGPGVDERQPALKELTEEDGGGEWSLPSVGGRCLDREVGARGRGDDGGPLGRLRR